MRNLHRITGATFTHCKPNLCPYCQHYRPDPQGWAGLCAAKGTRLCCATTDNGRCSEFARADAPQMAQVDIDFLTQQGREARETAS